MNKKIPLHTILLAGLGMLILGKLVFRFDLAFLYSFLVLSVTVLSYHMITKRGWTWDVSLKNTLIYGAILLLLIFPTDSMSGLVTLVGVALFGLIARSLVRYKGKPILNPAVLALLSLALLGLWAPSSLPIGIFTSWHGVNYQITILGSQIPFATIISAVLAICLTLSMKKYGYALSFFLSFVIMGYLMLDYDTVVSIMLDGTIYFFFGVMASEPKTGPSGKAQWLFGALLGVLLVLFLTYHIPGDYIGTIAAINVIYFIYQYLSRKNTNTSEVAIKGQKYLCVPCGYIYDPLIGDSDSGIVAGTEFSDIPDDWRCPVCGVTKDDFILYNDVDGPKTALVIEKTYLNPTTVELVIETPEECEVKPGQFCKILFEDGEGSFDRSYSVVRQRGKRLTFGIKLSTGRGSVVLKTLQAGDEIGFGGVFGNFVLQNTQNQKVFIATGTGLSPIIHMLELTPSVVSKTLYFSVSTKDELFYEEILSGYQNLDTHIFVSREEIAGYLHGRIHIDTEFRSDTEFYLCGNPTMIRDKKQELVEKGYTKIFSEAFL